MGIRTVKEINYTLVLTDSVSFEKAPPIVDTFPDFELKLEQDVLIATMTTPFTNVAQAKGKVEEVLRAWELDYLLKYGTPDISFQYRKTLWVEVDEQRATGSRTVHAEVGELFIIAGTVTADVTRLSYPAPPHHLAYSPDVESLTQRYLGYLQGKEPLLSMAYFCLTLLEQGGGRAAAARKYLVAEAVLKKIGELTSLRGDAQVARKFSKMSQQLSAAEEEWVKQALRLLIKRKSEYDFNPGQNFPEISVASLPPL